MAASLTQLEQNLLRMPTVRIRRLTPELARTLSDTQLRAYIRASVGEGATTRDESGNVVPISTDLVRRNVNNLVALVNENIGAGFVRRNPEFIQEQVSKNPEIFDTKFLQDFQRFTENPAALPINPEMQRREAQGQSGVAVDFTAGEQAPITSPGGGQATGWIDPATKQPTPVGVGIPAPSTSTTAPLGATSGQTGVSGQVPFREGLSDAQKQSITKLINTGRIFNETDARNYAYAVGESNWQQFVGQSGAQLGGQASQPTEVTTPTEQVSASQVTTGQVEAAGSTQTTQQLADTSKLPANITDADWYKVLSDEQKNLIALSYNSLLSGSEAQKADANKALEDAINLTDTSPYFKEQIRIVQDELLRGVTGTAADAQARVGRLQDRMNQIKEDLTFNREQLTLEQQSELSSQLRTYQNDLGNLQTTLTEAGLAFSSPRQMAEQQLSQQQAELAESTGRKFRRSLRELETGSLRGTQEAAADIAETTRKGGESVVEQLRRAEQQLGTKNLPTVSGVGGQQVSSLGGVTGNIEEQRQRAILDLQQTLLGRTEPINLPS